MPSTFLRIADNSTFVQLVEQFFALPEMVKRLKSQTAKLSSAVIAASSSGILLATLEPLHCSCGQCPGDIPFSIWLCKINTNSKLNGVSQLQPFAGTFVYTAPQCACCLTAEATCEYYIDQKAVPVCDVCQELVSADFAKAASVYTYGPAVSVGDALHALRAHVQQHLGVAQSDEEFLREMKISKISTEEKN